MKIKNGSKFNYSEILGVGAVLFFSANVVLAANEPLLNAVASAGACGGSVGCITQDNRTLQPATSSDSLNPTQTSTLADGSYAHSAAVVSFGTERVYADAFRADGAIYGDAQSKGYAEFNDYILANSSQIVNGVYQFTFAISGFHTSTDGISGRSAYSYLNWAVVDNTTNYGIDFGSWSSTDANPSTTITKNVTVSAGHDIRLRVQFEADAYMSNNVGGPSGGVVSDYSHTLNVYIDALTPGANTVGLSGHDYATPSVPLPASAWFFGSGLLGLIGSSRKRKIT